MAKQLLILFGGQSSEHEISLLSTRSVLKAIDRKNYHPILVGITRQGQWLLANSQQLDESLNEITLDLEKSGWQICTLIKNQSGPAIQVLSKETCHNLDVAFPVLHGTNGEDGSVQGYFQLMDLPFVGCGVLASAVGMDKEYTKRLLIEAQIPIVPYVVLRKSEKHSYDFLAQKLGLPFFIKPASCGSSVGVHKIKGEAEFKDKLLNAFQFDEKVLAEKFVAGREIECAVLGEGLHPRSSVCGEIVPTHEFYSYEAKYLDKNGAELHIPAKLPDGLHQNLRHCAEKAFQAINGSGLARVDFFLDKDQNFYVNEINTLPGFTKISMYPKMWAASGLEYTDLMNELIAIAVARGERATQLNRQKN